MSELFSTRLASAMQRSGLKQSEIARICGISGAYLSDLKNGKKAAPSLEIAKSLAQCLNVTADWLFAGEGISQNSGEEFSYILREEPPNDPRRDKVLANSLARAHGLVKTSDDRMVMAVEEIEARLLWMVTSEPARMDQLLKECHTRLDEFASWLTNLKKESSHAP